MTTEEAVSWGTEGLLFNAKDGFLEGIVRGCRAGLLTPADYANLAQCETLDDVKLHLCGTDYAGVIQNEPSPLHPSTIVARCTRKIVDDFEMMRCQASEPLATFLDYLTYGHMIDNVVLMVTGALHERDTQELLDKCHPLGMFDAIASLEVANSTRDLYRLVLVDTPLAPYFSECISGEDLDEMHVEIMRNTLYKAYLADFLRYCDSLGGATAVIMRRALTFEADRRAVNITINSLDTELSRDDRRRLFSDFGQLYPSGHLDLVACDDFEQVRAVMDASPAFAEIRGKLGGGGGQGGAGQGAGGDARGAGGDQMLEKHFYDREQRICASAFMEQFNYATFYAILKMREQEVRNVMWIAECVAQDCRNRVTDGLVHVGLD